MRRLLLLSFLTVAVVSSASALQLGVGAYGGANIPIVQEDQGSGTVFGLKGKLSLIPGISLEPNLNFAKFGDAELDFGATREGSKVTSYGIDAVVGAGMGTVGFKMYGLVGAGIYSTTRDNDEDASKFGWATGLGFEIGFSPTIGLDIRGKLNVINSEGGGTKKSAAVTGGLTYYIGY